MTIESNNELSELNEHLRSGFAGIEDTLLDVKTQLADLGKRVDGLDGGISDPNRRPTTLDKGTGTSLDEVVKILGEIKIAIVDGNAKIAKKIKETNKQHAAFSDEVRVRTYAQSQIGMSRPFKEAPQLSTNALSAMSSRDPMTAVYPHAR